MLDKWEEKVPKAMQILVGNKLDFISNARNFSDDNLEYVKRILQNQKTKQRGKEALYFCFFCYYWRNSRNNIADL
ncbi:hypothetical protein B4168_3999 [Anoxybacillus flavithermus]|nr:hypothetical protein B4168_3999 [Anoxybacillus flavithermus]OAO87623.1 hypothetical protein GT23_1272 [Parageobacillus thermoglucosidasius]